MQVIKSNENRYLNGKIYTIRSFQTEKYYIGSTIQPLYKRLHTHRAYYNTGISKITSGEIVKFHDNYIELLEDFPCENRLQLEKREGELIRQYKQDVVNAYISGRTNQEYCIDNKESILIYNENYYKHHKEYFQKYHKVYQQQNVEVIQKYKKEYRKINEEKIKANNVVKIICPCGASIQKINKARHEKSTKHNEYINSLKIEEQ
jgi:hypothetical protein